MKTWIICLQGSRLTTSYPPGDDRKGVWDAVKSQSTCSGKATYSFRSIVNTSVSKSADGKASYKYVLEAGEQRSYNVVEIVKKIYSVHLSEDWSNVIMMCSNVILWKKVSGEKSKQCSCLEEITRRRYIDVSDRIMLNLTFSKNQYTNNNNKCFE